MAYHRCMGLMVRDEGEYARYREAMTPLLHRAGGRFRYDFRVAETLASETEAPINRVFVIAFDSRAAHDAFFADPEYRRIREGFFVGAVSDVTQLGLWTDEAAP